MASSGQAVSANPATLKGYGQGHCRNQAQPLSVSGHGLFIVVAISVGVEIAKRPLRRWGHDPDAFERAASWVVLWEVGFWQSVLWYSLLRWVLDKPFRLNLLWLRVYETPQPGLGFLTATRLFSMPLALLAAWVLEWLKRRSLEGPQVVVSAGPGG